MSTVRRTPLGVMTNRVGELDASMPVKHTDCTSSSATVNSAVLVPAAIHRVEPSGQGRIAGIGLNMDDTKPGRGGLFFPSVFDDWLWLGAIPVLLVPAPDSV